MIPLTKYDFQWGHSEVVIIYPDYIYWLVVSTVLNNMKVNGKDDIPYIMEK